MLDVPQKSVHVNHNEMQIHCVPQPDGSVRLQCDDALSLHLEYGDLLRALECLEDVLSKPAYGLALAGNSFCAFHAGDGSYYLLFGDHVVLRFSQAEAYRLHDQLTMARKTIIHT